MGELKQAIDKFADGGELREFAEEYRSPVSTFDGPVLKMLAGSLSAEGVAELRRFVPVPENHAGARRAIDRFREVITPCKGTLYPNRAEAGFAPVVLAACWHAQDPDHWQPYSKARLERLKALSPDVCERHREDERTQVGVYSSRAVLGNLRGTRGRTWRSWHVRSSRQHPRPELGQPESVTG